MKPWMGRILILRARGRDRYSKHGGRYKSRRGREPGPQDFHDAHGLHVRVRYRRLIQDDFSVPIDYFAPLRRYLEKRVGQSWNEVWAEVCASNDVRSLRGWHLRLHVQFAVERDPVRIRRGSGHFYVEAGILKMLAPS